jgi:hypothetical protein
MKDCTVQFNCATTFFPKFLAIQSLRALQADL